MTGSGANAELALGAGPQGPGPLLANLANVKEEEWYWRHRHRPIRC
jgi:hypothetical protein